jgi:hypothetical protein
MFRLKPLDAATQSEQNESRFRDRSVKHLNRKLNAALQLPRGTERGWGVTSFNNDTPWEDFFKAYTGRIALTELGDHYVAGQFRWPQLKSSQVVPLNPWRPTVMLRLLPDIPTADEIFDQYRTPLDCWKQGEPFSNTLELNQALSGVLLKEVTQTTAQNNAAADTEAE